jgi:hypothetical protein
MRDIKLKKQNGAAMLETAIVLPFMLTAILLIVEAVDYAINSFAVGDAVNMIHGEVSRDISSVSRNGKDSHYASCEDGAVTLKRTVIKDDVKAKALSRLKSLSPSLDINGSASVPEPLLPGVYIMEFEGEVPMRILPINMSRYFPIKVNTIISVKDSCTPP